MRLRAAFCLFFLALVQSLPATALPAPMSDDQLLAKSDLVALVKVLSVTCVSVHRDETTGQMLPSYTARLKLLEVMKGDETEGDVVTATFHQVPAGLLGPWSVYYYPGEEVWTHLVRDGDNYTTTWWNGRKQVLHEAVIKDLPDRPGETVTLPEAKP